MAGSAAFEEIGKNKNNDRLNMGEKGVKEKVPGFWLGWLRPCAETGSPERGAGFKGRRRRTCLDMS